MYKSSWGFLHIRSAKVNFFQQHIITDKSILEHKNSVATNTKQKENKISILKVLLIIKNKHTNLFTNQNQEAQQKL